MSLIQHEYFARQATSEVLKRGCHKLGAFRMNVQTHTFSLLRPHKFHPCTHVSTVATSSFGTTS